MNESSRKGISGAKYTTIPDSKSFFLPLMVSPTGGIFRLLLIMKKQEYFEK